MFCSPDHGRVSVRRPRCSPLRSQQPRCDRMRAEGGGGCWNETRRDSGGDLRWGIHLVRTVIQFGSGMVLVQAQRTRELWDSGAVGVVIEPKLVNVWLEDWTPVWSGQSVFGPCEYWDMKYNPSKSCLVTRVSGPGGAWWRGSVSVCPSDGFVVSVSG